MKKILTILLMAILMVCCVSTASAISNDDTIDGEVQVISCDVTYTYYSGVSSDYYYTGPNGGSDAYYYVVSAEGEIQLNISNVTADDASQQDYINANFTKDLNRSLEDDEDDDDAWIHLSAGLSSDYTMSSYSIDGDIMTIRFNGTSVTQYDERSDLCDDWEESNAHIVLLIQIIDFSDYLIQTPLDGVNMVHG